MRKSSFRTNLPWFAAIFVCLFGLVLAPYQANAQDFLEQRFSGSSFSHLMGIDGLGRDVFSRIWEGSANTILLGFFAASLAMLVSAILLLLEQISISFIARIIQGLVSIGLALPAFFMGLVFLIFFERSPSTVAVAVALAGVPIVFRQLRILWMEQKNALHTTASVALGGGAKHILVFGVWPNARGQVLALFKLVFAISVLEFSGLAFLGLSGDPDFPELGTMLKQYQGAMFQQPMLIVWPGLFLSSILLITHLSNPKREA